MMPPSAILIPNKTNIIKIPKEIKIEPNFLITSIR